MHLGLSRFEHFLNKLQAILILAAKEKNPGLYLYKNNARTPLFMLEALARMYGEFHNKKKFEKITTYFKSVEDAIGAVDYYDNMAKAFASNKKIPASIINYLQAETREKLQSLNELLTEKDWLNPTESRLAKIHEKLTEADWKSEKKEANEIATFYVEAIYDIKEFLAGKKFSFMNMEDDVHELRRKYRWLSIYPQALLGAIQLSKAGLVPAYLKKYATPAITASPYNQMPEGSNCKYQLLLKQSHLFALSWMIDALGTLKDKGLYIIALNEALQATTSMDEDASYKKAYQLLGTGYPTVRTLMNEAQQMAQTFDKESVLETLVVGVLKKED